LKEETNVGQSLYLLTAALLVGQTPGGTVVVQPYQDVRSGQCGCNSRSYSRTYPTTEMRGSYVADNTERRGLFGRFGSRLRGLFGGGRNEVQMTRGTWQQTEPVVVQSPRGGTFAEPPLADATPEPARIHPPVRTQARPVAQPRSTQPRVVTPTTPSIEIEGPQLR
jgi:hypothetical protein